MVALGVVVSAFGLRGARAAGRAEAAPTARADALG